LVEDNPADVFLIQEALREARVSADLVVLMDGESAARFFDAADMDESAPVPQLCLLDLNLPKIGGCDVLRHLRRSPRCKNTQVIIVTSSNSDHERQETTQLGAVAYFRKPSAYREYLRLGEIVKAQLFQS